MAGRWKSDPGKMMQPNGQLDGRFTIFPFLPRYSPYQTGPKVPMAVAGSLEKLLPSSFYFSFFLFVWVVGAAKANGFSRDITPTKIGLRRERLSHLHFYFHDSLGGPNPSAVIVAEAPATNASKTLFGAVVMMDDPLTAGPEPSSKTVGRAQGIFASASQSELGYLMVLTFGFSQGKYNGSTLSVLGRNTVMSVVREMPIVGGSGLFRFARGYAQAHTHSLNFKEQAAVVEYNVYVFHY